jgi:hypothetical protein
MVFDCPRDSQECLISWAEPHRSCREHVGARRQSAQRYLSFFSMNSVFSVAKGLLAYPFGHSLIVN